MLGSILVGDSDVSTLLLSQSYALLSTEQRSTSLSNKTARVKSLTFTVLYKLTTTRKAPLPFHATGDHAIRTTTGMRLDVPL